MVIRLTPVSQIAQHLWRFISLISRGWLELQPSVSCAVCGGKYTRPDSSGDTSAQQRCVVELPSPESTVEPSEIINENHPNKKYSDKSLGLWNISDIPS